MNIEQLNKDFQNAESKKIIKYALKKYKNEIVISSSFANEGMVIIDIASKLKIPFKVLTIDTGRLYEESYELMEIARNRYDLDLEIFVPETQMIEKLYRTKGIYSFRNNLSNRKECCHLRKVIPLKRGLRKYSTWITGMRREQSITRTGMKIFEEDKAHKGMLKINPLANWSEDEVLEYIKKHDVPFNKLYNQGFPSIGCAPCTRSIEEGENARAGRWWWEPAEKKECGIHLGNKKRNDITLFFIMDGTLLNTDMRQYFVYKDIMEDYVENILSREAFWALKKNGFSIGDILDESGNKKIKKEILKEWSKRIEDDNYLSHDIPFPKTYETLENLSNSYNLVLISERGNRQNAMKQIERLELNKYFSEIILILPGVRPAFKKKNKIKNSQYFNQEKSWLIGDSRSDIKAGSLLNMKTVGISSGSIKTFFIKKFKPKYMIEDITKLPELIDFDY
ncbi:MAG: phosphoadenylyl-sulfate reductase [Candidatus Marinimicrobia bacterium]|nr:phosphoadenylyl-sulfate reductase [Candidatus Neomarinimicrobiota bacterium]